MGTIDATIRLQALNGAWETCGADRAISVVPESLMFTHDEWGPKTASFTLKRPVVMLWPDLGAFTPVEIEIGGVVVWEGRTSETPVKDGAEQQINVQCEGWQAHLDDDVYQRAYVHSKLTDWKDARSSLETNLAVWISAYQVQAAQGAIVLTAPNGASIIGGSTAFGGVILDLGPNGLAKRVVVKLEGTTYPEGQYKIVCRAAASIAGIALAEGEGNVAWSGDPGNIASIQAGTLTTAARYVSIFVYRTAATAVETADRWIKITAVSTFADTAFETGNASILTGDVIEKDALERATLLLSPDFSNIAARTFHIPDFVLAKASTPREVIEAENAYYNYVTKLLTGRRFSSQPRPTDPLLEIGAWSRADTEDTSANSAAEIYNRALVEAASPDGTPALDERNAIQQPGVALLAPEAQQPTNPSFATNTTSWTPSGTSSIARVTGAEEFQSGTSGGKWTAKNGDSLTETINGTFVKGVTYYLSFYAKRILSGNIIRATFGIAGDHASVYLVPTSVFLPTTIAWTPTANRSGVTLLLESLGEGFFIDTLLVRVAEPTLVDRRGFRRTKVIQMSSAITETEGNQIADIFLRSHMSTPFKGSASLGPGSVRRVLGGQSVHPSLLGGYTQQLIRLGHLTDPDTGGIGRDGTIAEVAYEHKTQKATVTLDDKRGNFDALLARLAVVQTPGS